MDKTTLKDRLEVIIKQDESQPVQEDEISLRDIILALIRGKKTIAVTLIVTLLAALFFTSFTNPERDTRYKSEVIVTFNFDGIEKGLDPQGNRFDVGKIKSPEVLDRVTLDMDLKKHKIDTELLRRNIEITPIVPGKIVEKIQRMIEAVPKNAIDSASIARLEDYMYYPTQYKITFNTPRSINIDTDLSQEILQGVVDSYTTYFYDQYSDRQVLADAVQKISYADYDYPEVPLIMRNQIDLMVSYLAAKSQEAPDFRSKVTGLSFNDVSASLKLIDDIDINNLNSVITSYRITKDRDKLISSYEYRIKANQVKMAKSLDEARQSAEVRDRYQKDKTMVFMGNGTGTADGNLELEKTSPVYDELAQRSLNAGVQATNIQHDIEYLTKEIAIYKNDVTIPEAVRQQKVVQVTQMIDACDKKMRNWIDLTNKTLDDYLKSVYFERSVMQATPVQVSRPVLTKLPLNLAIALVLGLMLGVFIALFQDYWRKNDAEADTNEEQTVAEQSVSEG